jgi:putative ABC transport system permease protein
MYHHLPKLVIPYNMEFALVASVAALACTLGATFAACYKELLAVPAELMRPPAPKQGKRVLLERIGFIWNHLSFTWKSTVRNLLRYKKRFLMTIIGIGGCMGLLLVGYGLQDSIKDIANLQFDNLQLYDAMVIVDTDASDEEQQVPMDILQEDTRVEAATRFYAQQQDVQTEGIVRKEWSVYIYVPEDLEAFEQFICLRDRKTKEGYSLSDEGAILTEKIANELNLKAGDTIKLKREEGEDVEVPILAVCENYLSHYLYMTPALYEKLYGEAPEYNCILWKSDEDQQTVEKIGEQLLKQDVVLNITYTGTLAEQLDNMLGAMDVVMIVIIVSAGMLAFVVLYNLNNININERRRELATLKVLGFFDGEVAAYVYRENILLTLIGAALGIFLGKLLHMYVITTVEVDACMFGRNINVTSFVYGTLFTIGFSVIVNVAMYFKLKKIDMVESLKSIE